MKPMSIQECAQGLIETNRLFINYCVQCLIEEGNIHPNDKQALMRAFADLMEKEVQVFKAQSKQAPQGKTQIFSF